MRKTVRCCPQDCAVRSDWEEELQREKMFIERESIGNTSRYFKVLGHPIRLRMILMLLNRDHCVCEFWYVFAEPQNLISYNLGVLKKEGLVASYYRSKHKMYTIPAAAAPFLQHLAAIMKD